MVKKLFLVFLFLSSALLLRSQDAEEHISYEIVARNCTDSVYCSKHFRLYDFEKGHVLVGTTILRPNGYTSAMGSPAPNAYGTWSYYFH